MKKVSIFFTLFMFVFSVLKAEVFDPNKTVTIYVHGFNNGGYKRKATYGEDKYEEFFNSIPSFIGLPTTNRIEDKNKPNVVATTDYYGDKPPSYYTAKDIEDIEEITAEYGGGIPRYAMIMAKYAKHLLKRTKAKQVNFVSGSMGALVTRWLIEKDYEHLASEGKIARWLTLEGVVGGNYAASNDFLMKVWDEVDEPSIDVEHMSYNWINVHLHNPHRDTDSPYLKNILVGHETSTKDDAKEHALTILTMMNGQYMPNDGFQVVYDTYFNRMAKESRFMGLMPTHSYFHVNHLQIKNAKGAWVQIAAFLLSNKRVEITLKKATVYDLHEKNKWYARFLPAEVVFDNRFFSPYAKKRWGIEDAISQRTLGGGVIPIFKFHQAGEEKEVNQVLFNDFVFPRENNLKLKLSAIEIDADERYGIFESLKNRKYDNIDTIEVNVPLKNGVYEYKGESIKVSLEVKVINYPFKLLGEDGVGGFDDEELKKIVLWFYKSALQREASEKEIKFWVSYLKNRPDKIYTISKNFLLSREIANKDLSNEEFIILSYKSVFGYEPNDIQINNWLNAFDRGISRKDFIEELLRNPDSVTLIKRVSGKEGGINEDIILNRGDLVHFEKVMSKNASFLQDYFKNMLSEHPELTVDKIHGVEAYKIIYTTINADGKKVNASGLVTIPKDKNYPLDIVSDQHGTKFGNFDVPSTHDPLGSVGTLVTATKGYVVSMPDYVGYGKSLKYFHPYLIKRALSANVIDMLLAVRKFLKQKGIKESGRLFLSGYSEGGYVTMAALEEIEKHYKDVLPVTAAAPMAGSYDMKTTADMVLAAKDYKYPNLPAFVLYSYNYYYKWNKLNEIFKPPYDKELDRFFKEKAKGNMLHIDLPSNRDKLYQDKFIKDYFEKKEKWLEDALIENSLLDWKPTMKMRLYHCKGDDVVPVINSINAYNSFVKNGSDSVELVTKEGGSHGECSIPFYIDAYEWFDTFR